MAIQKINLGSEPLGEGGDTYRSANTKINENFSNTTHAASRLVGEDVGNVIQVGSGGFLSRGVPEVSLSNAVEIKNIKSGFYALSESSLSVPNVRPSVITSTQDKFFLKVPYTSAGAGGALFFPYFASTSGQIVYRTHGAAEASITDYVFYTDKNTTKDTATGFLKASSPVLHVYNDSITKIHEANQLDIKVEKKGVGHYEIHGTTGLRKNDGWFMSPPRDMHSNVLCMVDYEEKDGVIILKTYKKKFDFETVSIVHDYENPMDIPEGSCVEFRFNDLPQEMLEDFETEA